MARPTRQTKRRTPAGMPRQKLKVEGIPAGKKAYWAKESQFQELQDAGYTFMANNGDLEIGEDGYINKSSIISRPASRTEEERLYLMEIDKEFYEENQKIKQNRILETERQIFNREDTPTTYAVKGNKRTTETIGAEHG